MVMMTISTQCVQGFQLQLCKATMLMLLLLLLMELQAYAPLAKKREE